VSFLWPSIDDSKDAEAASLGAAGVCLVVCAITGSAAIAAIVTGNPVIGLHGTALLDASLFGLLGFFILKKHSRAASVLALLAYLGEMIGTATLHGLGAPGSRRAFRREPGIRNCLKRLES